MPNNLEENVIYKNSIERWVNVGNTDFYLKGYIILIGDSTENLHYISIITRKDKLLLVDDEIISEISQDYEDKWRMAIYAAA